LATAKGEFMHSSIPVVPNVNLDENVDGSPYDVCLWHLADMDTDTEHVRSGSKADIADRVRYFR
jgi:hypothetical protein